VLTVRSPWRGVRGQAASGGSSARRSRWVTSWRRTRLLGVRRFLSTASRSAPRSAPIAAGEHVHTHNLRSAHIGSRRGTRRETAAGELASYERQDGGKGVRNVVAVTYLVECAHHVAREITTPFRERGVHTIGFPGCYPNAYASEMLGSLCTHPNVGAVLLVSLGCESFRRAALRIASRSPVDL